MMTESATGDSPENGGGNRLARRSFEPALIALVLVASVAVVLAGRITAPSDLHERAQVRTMAYTMDVVIHGRWLLPRDTDGTLATKPPMYNWIGALVQLAVGRWDEWVLRSPSVLAGLATLAFVAVGGAYVTRGDSQILGDRSGGASAVAVSVGLAAATIALANHLGVRLIYELRPNGVLTAFLVGAWVSATLLMADTPRSSALRRVALQALLWLCVTAAALTKGPAALLPLIYIPLAAWLIHDQPRRSLWTGVAWGLPLALLLVAGWLLAVHRADPNHLWSTLVDQEMLSRVRGGSRRPGFLRNLLDAWLVPVYFVSRFLPWSVLVVIALTAIRPRFWMKHALAPAILWVLVVLGFFMLVGNKKATYIASALPAGAVIAAYWLTRLETGPRWRPTSVALGAMVVALGLTGYAHFFPRFGDDEEARRVHTRTLQRIEALGRDNSTQPAWDGAADDGG